MKNELIKICVVSLGCDKNRVDTENMLYKLSENLNCSLTNDYFDADVIIINTCAFIEAARKEAIETILEAAEYKKHNLKKLIVTGCLPQKYLEEIKDELPEVDAFLGIADYDKIAEAVLSQDRFFAAECRDAESEKRILSTNDYAYLKIADGCNNHCTFCTIPKIRGAYRSRNIDSLVNEAKSLIEKGARELILVAQDVTKYGVDNYGKKCLIDLINRLCATDVDLIRLMYCYPEDVDDELIETIANNPKVAKYIDVPIQHVSDNVLKAMNRKSDNKTIINLFEKLSQKKIAIRTTFMVGFPGESEEDFDQLCQFAIKYKPLNAGVFAYSKEKESSSYKMKGHLPYALKQKRKKILSEILYKNTLSTNQNFVGKTLKVLYEGIDYDKKCFFGRSEFQAPDVDGKVYFSGEYANAGHYYDVEITSFKGYDLVGKIKY